MGEIRQYVFSVICISLICGIMQLLVTGKRGSSVKLLTGLMVTIVAIGPVLNGDIDLNFDVEKIADNRQWAILDGEMAAQESLSAYIKESTETYILDKADALGADISVDVELDNDSLPVPFAVTVSGLISPYTKQQLIGYMSEELGINEENQRWIS